MIPMRNRRNGLVCRGLHKLKKEMAAEKHEAVCKDGQWGVKAGERKMKKNKRYIVYPHGALSWEEILETVELLKYEGANPEIVKYHGFWNVSADRGGVKKENGSQMGR